MGLGKVLGDDFKNFTETSGYTYSKMHGVSGASQQLIKYNYTGNLNYLIWPFYLIPVK